LERFRGDAAAPRSPDLASADLSLLRETKEELSGLHLSPDSLKNT
jgi:hypothetical protein